MVVLVDVSAVAGAGEGRYADGVGNPLVEDNLQGDGRWPQVAVELYFEEISLYKGIDGYALVLGLGETLGGDGEGHLTLLEVEVDRGEDGHDGLGGVGRGVEGAVGCWDVVVEVAFGNTVHIDDGCRYIRSYVDDYFAPGQDVSFGQIVSQEENNLYGSCLSNRQFYGALHRVEFHLSDVSCCFIYHHVLGELLG